MCEILIKAKDPDSYDIIATEDEWRAKQSCWRKCDIINIKHNGWSNIPGWDQSQYAAGILDGRFVVAKVPTVSRETALVYRGPWQRALSITQIENNHPEYVYDLSINMESVASIEGISRDQVRKFLIKNDADILDHGTNWVRVRFSLGPKETLQKKRLIITKVLRRFRRAKHCISHSDVDWVQSQGGMVTLTAQQAASKIKTKLEYET